MLTPADLRVTSSDPDSRSQMSADVATRTGIDEAMIGQLVRAFYARAAHDPVLGPIFAEHVDDWNAHLETICQFWSSVALMSGRYHGTPMAAHKPLPLGPEAFARWLTLFEATAADICPPEAAAHFVERARRIATNLEIGVATKRGEILPP